MNTRHLLIAALMLPLALFGARETETRTFEGVKSVDLRMDIADLTVIKTGGKSLEVLVQYDGSMKKDMDLSFDQSRGTVTIEQEYHGRGSWGKETELEIRLQIPEGVDLRVASASGDIVIEGMSGELNVSVASGDVEVRELSGSFKIQSASGDVEVYSADGSGKISTASGDVKVHEAEGPLTISTASGDVEAESVNQEISISTASGDIELDRIATVTKASAASGDISVKDCMGAGELSTASGDIRCEGLKNVERAEFSSASGDVEVSMDGDIRGKLSLSAASGDVKLELNGHSVYGKMESVNKNQSGNFSSNVDTESKENFKRGRTEYVRTLFATPEGEADVELETASGRVTVNK